MFAIAPLAGAGGVAAGGYSRRFRPASGLSLPLSSVPPRSTTYASYCAYHGPFGVPGRVGVCRGTCARSSPLATPRMCVAALLEHVRPRQCAAGVHTGTQGQGQEGQGQQGRACPASAQQHAHGPLGHKNEDGEAEVGGAEAGEVTARELDLLSEHMQQQVKKCTDELATLKARTHA